MNLKKYSQTPNNKGERNFTEWWSKVPSDLKEKSRTAGNISLENQVTFVLLNLHLVGKHVVKPTQDEIKAWVNTGQLERLPLLSKRGRDRTPPPIIKQILKTMPRMGRDKTPPTTQSTTTPSIKKKSIHNTYRILFVDDDLDVLSSIKQGLEDNGSFIVDAFTDPLKALSAFRRELYDLLLIDVKMPQMNGFVLYQEIKKKAAKSNNDNDIKTCFITAYGTYYETFKKEFPELDVGSFIFKPIKIRDLINRIEEKLA